MTHLLVYLGLTALLICSIIFLVLVVSWNRAKPDDADTFEIS